MQVAFLLEDVQSVNGCNECRVSSIKTV